MASSLIWTGVRFIATWRLRVDTYHADVDIAREPRVLAERIAYEERRHDGLPRNWEMVFVADNHDENVEKVT